MIYVYHNIGNNSHDENTVSVRDFRRQMKQLFLSGKQVVHMCEYDMNNPNHAVITFDDGYCGILHVLDILRQYKFPFEVYLVGDWFGQDGFLNTHTVNQVLAAGGRLQWHTKTHCDLTNCSELTTEMTVPDAIKRLDKKGFDSVAYPFWKNNAVVEKAARQNFKNARSGNGHANRSQYSMDAIKVKKDTDMSDKIVKFIDVTAPTWPCNFRCHYCYVGQQMSDCERAVVNKCKYSPDEFARAISKKRLGGTCVFNFCSFGETLILPQNVEYCKKILEQGHFIGIVTNMTITKHIQELLSLPSEYLSRLFFKCSFHYMELKRLGLLDTFVKNVNDAWNAGASITVEITPSDELEPYIDEVKEFSIKHFGALPHITIGRNELVPGYVRLTKHTEDEYNKIWNQFDSELFRFKTHIWEKKVKDFCYAGKWGYGIDLGTGKLYTCSHRKVVGDLCHGRKIKQKPVCKKCPAAHCFNGHAWLAWGACPSINNTTYALVRDRIRTDGTHWLHPRVYDAFSQRLWENNKQYNKFMQWFKNLFA